jgi:restriction system protein
LTEKGHEYARSHPEPLSEQTIQQLVLDFIDVRLRPSSDEVPSENLTRVHPAASIVVSSPDDRLGQALTEIRQAVAAEIAEALSRVSPAFFETIVLDLLHKLGYGTSRSDLQRVGGVGDGGIDGIISLDRLGLEKVYVQAKRWQNPVGRPEVQAFYGALAGNRAAKGVLITTSSFSPQAREFAKSVGSASARRWRKAGGLDD